ncbi:sigma-54-dependent transcriptional regulator [Fuerstiella marisgermanici]|uniref:Transcriptional regulatory protein ZraR n=1 Tax=Fuerstiella marisgermanici TaxID=1891926 RepID=A0A1P8WJD6_9PLAN|nr:sigma-54 dependent transcriptional regulator [Fuerstiella marisgermanici]APZ94163.1 Transcriptional regulatory protein ZraR [Fuerstiella marisgermanici]
MGDRTHGHVLVIDDEKSMCDLLRDDLSLRGFTVDTFTSPAAALKEIAVTEADVVLTDLNMPQMDGLRLCERVVANRPDLPVVVMTAFGSLESAIEAIRAGAWDFVTKPVESDLLEIVLQRAVRHHEVQEELRQLSTPPDGSEQFEDMLGANPPMQRVFQQIRQVAPTQASVLITGESGTGKELAARAIHRRSQHKDGPFVAINCAALPENLLESELFGHAKGAFTDAREARRGLFQQADKGTLFLDEIGDFPLTLQAKLLRAMEERMVRPVGGNEETAFDARILTATNRDLQRAVEEGRYREDFYYRINVIQLELPPLRARGTDVLLISRHLVRHFAQQSGKQVTGLTEPVAERLLNYSWPGNVRELRNVIERAVALTQVSKLVVDDLPENIRNYRQTQMTIDSLNPDELQPLEAVEQRYIRHVLDSVNDNRTEAARILGIDRKTLYRRLKEYDADAG